MAQDIVDWSERPITRWLGSITRDTTQSVYKSAFRFYARYTGLTATQIIDEAIEDLRSDPREKMDIVQQRLIGFYNWICNDCPKFNPKGIEVGKGRSSKMADTYVGAIRSLYSRSNFKGTIP